MNLSAYRELKKVDEALADVKEMLPAVEDEATRNVLQCLSWALEHTVAALGHIR